MPVSAHSATTNTGGHNTPSNHYLMKASWVVACVLWVTPAHAGVGMGAAVSLTFGYMDRITLGWGAELRAGLSNPLECETEGIRVGVGPTLQYAQGNQLGARITGAIQLGAEVDPMYGAAMVEVGRTYHLDGGDPGLHTGIKASSMFGHISLRGEPGPSDWTLGIGPDVPGAHLYGTLNCLVD